MDEIKIMEQNKKFNPKIGEFIYDVHNVFKSYVPKNILIPMIPLIYFGSILPFQTLIRMDINPQLLLDSKYPCPFNSGNSFYGIVPIGIQTEDPNIYRRAELAHNSYDWLFDLEWQARYVSSGMPQDNSPVLLSFLGHGYNDGILPNDGGNSIVNVMIELSNGDYILAKTFEWYNK